jgi:surfeit locus 1 family protein
MRASRLLLPSLMTLVALAVLIGLGTWQMQRLQWKTALLERIRAGLESGQAAIGAETAVASATKRLANAGPADEFSPIRVRGRFDHDEEIYVFTVRAGRKGFLVFTPLVVSGCEGEAARCRVWINRGFVPDELRAPQQRPLGQIESETEVAGILRLRETPGMFTPAPDPAGRTWYAASFPEQAYIEAGDAPNPGGWPRGRSPQELLASIPNRHAEYAMTWFGLAVVLAVIYAFYLRSRLRRAD